jgi:hypothetical protein
MNILEALEELEKGNIIRHERRPECFDAKEDTVRYYMETRTIPFDEKDVAHISIIQEVKTKDLRLSDLDYCNRINLPLDLVKSTEITVISKEDMLKEIIDSWKKRQKD